VRAQRSLRAVAHRGLGTLARVGLVAPIGLLVLSVLVPTPQVGAAVALGLVVALPSLLLAPALARSQSVWEATQAASGRFKVLRLTAAGSAHGLPHRRSRSRRDDRLVPTLASPLPLPCIRGLRAIGFLGAWHSVPAFHLAVWQGGARLDVLP